MRKTIRTIIVAIFLIFFANLCWADEPYQICEFIGKISASGEKSIGEGESRLKILQAWTENEEWMIPVGWHLPGDAVDIMALIEVWGSDCLINWMGKVELPSGEIMRIEFPGDYWHFEPGLHSIGIGTHFHDIGIHKAMLKFWTAGHKDEAKKIKVKFRVIDWRE